MTRRLKPDELELWTQVTATVKPRRRAAAPKADAKPEPLAAPAAKPPRRKPVTVKPAPPPQASVTLKPAPDPFDTTGIDGKRAAKLRKGELVIDARIDLHGLTLAPAHAALIDFIGASRARGCRLVLVITGKGGREGGALKRLVPLWLREAGLNPLIAAMAPAHARHGGSGAIYVYLRRRRGDAARKD